MLDWPGSSISKCARDTLDYSCNVLNTSVLSFELHQSHLQHIFKCVRISLNTHYSERVTHGVTWRACDQSRSVSATSLESNKVRSWMLFDINYTYTSVSKQNQTLSSNARPWFSVLSCAQTINWLCKSFSSWSWRNCRESASFWWRKAASCKYRYWPSCNQAYAYLLTSLDG